MKEKNKNIWKHVNLQIQAIYVDKDKFKKSVHIFEDEASSVQVGIKHVIL